MKIYISADGEGISGVVHSEEMHESGRLYDEFRQLMTADVNAAIVGAFAGGATEVLVNDVHWSSLNILYDQLDERAEIIRGGNKKLSMVEGVQGFDGMFFIGYHAKVGHSHGVGNETMVGPEMYEMRMNGQAIGELELNAALAGHYGVPLIMASGDDCLETEVSASFPDVQTAVVKKSIHRWAARCLPLALAHEKINHAAKQAVQTIDSYKAYEVAGPVELEIEWVSTAACERACLVPGAYAKSARIVAYQGADIIEAWEGIIACLNLGVTGFDPIYG